MAQTLKILARFGIYCVIAVLLKYKTNKNICKYNSILNKSMKDFNMSKAELEALMETSKTYYDV